jgi:predicted CoA-substrate-specific enzyme activase
MYLGIDVGSISVNVAVIDDSKKVLKDYYAKIEGEALKKTYKTLMDALDRFPEIEGMAATGSGGKLISKILDIPFVNEIVAQATSTSFLYPSVRTIIEIGGEDSKFILLEKSDSLSTHIIKDFATNTVCAAGTGSFLDEQAVRLGLTIEEFGELALKSTDPPRIAGRCSVFAKTDMIHLQQEATPEEDIVGGLCYALARNFKSTIAKGKEYIEPIAFQGGVAANKGIRRAFEDILKTELIIPDYHASMGAIGAALKIFNKPNKFKGPEEIERYRKNLTDESVPLPRLRNPKQYKEFKIWSETPEVRKKTEAYIGIDVGSVSTNVVAIDNKKQLLAREYLATAGRPIEAVREGIRRIGNKIGGSVEIKGLGTTGSGRHMIGDVVGADVVKNEITAQATASMEIDKSVDTVFEIGGQDSKYISLENGAIVDFEMNKVCAAGTGSFLEEQANRLNINIKEEFGECALKAKKPLNLGERCTVFMQSQLVEHQQRGADREDLTAGLAYSIVYNYLNRVVGNKKVGKNIFFQGAVAHNKAVVAAFESVLGKPITVPPQNDVTGAIGVAMIAMENENDNSKFKGFDLSKKNYSIETFECNDCPNMCEIKKVLVEGESPIYYGSRCGKYDIKEKKTTSNFPDLFKEREELLTRNLKNEERDIKIGIPNSTLFKELMPFFITFFQEIGCQVILSSKTNKKIIHSGVESVISEHCFPIKVTHGHILNLMDKELDYIFLPSIINMEKENHGISQSYTCPYIQALPYIVNAALTPERLLTPILYFKRGKNHIKNKLGKLARKLGKKNVAQAVEKAYEAQDEFYKSVKERGRAIIKDLKDKAIIIVGRPYNTCDTGLNLDIPKIVSNLGLLPVPVDFLDLEGVDLAEDWPNMYWKYGQRILSALRIIRDNPKLYPLYITNFGCGPDSFLLNYFNEEMGRKPCLIIEVDEHSAPAGIITRCEAFRDSIGNAPCVGNKEKIWPSKFKNANLRGKKLYIPFMGDNSYLLASTFKSFGIDAEVMPIADEEAMEYGRKHTLGKECLPCIITTGDMIKVTRRPDFDRERAAFFMPESSGPCRFGQYNKLQRKVLNDIGYPDVPIVSPNQADKFYQNLKEECGSGFDRKAWVGICSGDILSKLLRETRPYEVHEGETNRVYNKSLKKICRALENDEKISKVLGEIKRDFENIDVNRDERKPAIGIVGEIFVRYHPTANDNLADKVEKLSGEVWLPPTAEWFFYTIFRRKEDAKWNRNYKDFIYHYLKDKWMKHKEHSIQKRFKHLLNNFEEPPTEEVFKYSNPYLHRTVEGEAPLTVGKSVDFIKKGASGIVNVMPFSCMPGTNASATMQKLKDDYDNIPVLHMAYDGLIAQESRVEAFMHQARQYMTLHRKDTT